MGRKSLLFLLLFPCFVGMIAANVFATPKNSVVVTIKPLHSLVSGVIGDVGTGQTFSFVGRQ